MALRRGVLSKYRTVKIRGFTVVIIEHAAETLALFEGAVIWARRRPGRQQLFPIP